MSNKPGMLARIIAQASAEPATEFVRFYEAQEEHGKICLISINPTKQAIPSGQMFRAELQHGGESELFVATAEKTIKEGQRIKVIKETGRYWAYPLTGSDNTTRKKGEMKTLYDNHKDSEGNEIPIFRMRDSQLQNMIRFTVDRFVKQREAMSKNISHQDHMIAALSKNIGWDAKEIAGRTKDVLERLNPYLQEALVRGRTVAETAVTAMQCLTERQTRVEMKPTTIKDEAEDLNWDTIGGNGPMLAMD